MPSYPSDNPMDGRGTPQPDGTSSATFANGWQTVNPSLEAIAVPGGWIYRCRRNPQSTAMIFVPAPREFVVR
jgi:hypothetical protein